MANQPPSRPWLRLASIRIPSSDSAPAPTPALTAAPVLAPAQSRPLLSLPTFRSVAPTLAPTPTPLPSPSPVANGTSSLAPYKVSRGSSPKPQVTDNIGRSSPMRAASPSSSPVPTLKTVPYSTTSPTQKASTPPSASPVPKAPFTSSFTTKPTVTYSPSRKGSPQETSKPTVTYSPPRKENQPETSKVFYPQQMPKSSTPPVPKPAIMTHHQSPKEVLQPETNRITPHKYERRGNKVGDKKEKDYNSDSSDDGMGIRIITITGDNSGAVMEVKIHSPTKGHVMQSESMNTFINNNVQGINNSIVFNSYYKNNHPGVHITSSRNYMHARR